MSVDDPGIGPVKATRRAGATPSGRLLRDRWARLLARSLARSAVAGTIRVDGPYGGFNVGSGGREVVVRVNHPSAFRATLRRGSIGFAETYIDRCWDTDDLTGLVRIVLRNLERLLGRLDRLVALVDRPWSALQRRRGPTKDTDRHNVRAHYDLPGSLFEIMLDETMMYSCAFFVTPEATLHEAQLAKLEMICEKLDLSSHDHLLEIGTGWGGLALYAASTRGCRVTTTTVSSEQRKVTLERVAAAGLSERVEVLDQDYRDLAGAFTKLVSIEMIEAVDWRLHETFFRACERLLAPDGVMLLQTITIDDRSYARARFSRDFIKELIFPGGCLPSVTSITDTLTRTTDLRVVGLEDIGDHYATTLRHWRENFEARWASVAPEGFGEEFRRLWVLYLCYCEAGFLEHHVSDVQMLLAAPRGKPPSAAR